MTVVAKTNYIRHLNAFYAKVRKDDQLRANHISLYLALFQVWNQHRFHSPFPILREEVIRLCHIGSLNTYTQCLKDLHSFGYVTYEPAPKRGAPSLVSITAFRDINQEKNTTQLSLFPEISSSALHPNFLLNCLIEMASSALTACSKTGTVHRKNETATSRNSETGSVAKLRHFNNKHMNSEKREKKNTHAPFKKNKKNEVNNHHPAPAGQPSEDAAARPAAPTLDQVLQFFQGAGYPELEGRKFFYHYKANGWRQASKIPIADWQAAGDKWMLNDKQQKTAFYDIRNTKPTQPGRLHANEDKDYSYPL